MKIRNKLPNGQTVYGSGTVVAVGSGKGLVLTCFHLFQDDKNNDRFVCGEVTLTWSNGATCKAKYVGNDKDKVDLAALSFDTAPFGGDSKVPFVPVADSPQPSRDTWHVGYPFGGRQITRTGHVVLDERPVPRELHATFGSEQGESGGGIFRSDGRAVIGVLWGKEGRTGTALGVPRSETRRFAEAAWKQCFVRDRVFLVPQTPIYQYQWPAVAPAIAAPSYNFDPGVIGGQARIEADQRVILDRIDLLRQMGCSSMGAGVSVSQLPLTMPPAAILPAPPVSVPPGVPPGIVKPPSVLPSPGPSPQPAPTTAPPLDGVPLGACPPGKS